MTDTQLLYAQAQRYMDEIADTLSDNPSDQNLKALCFRGMKLIITIRHLAESYRQSLKTDVSRETINPAEKRGLSGIKERYRDIIV